jgi:hypothetical protein
MEQDALLYGDLLPRKAASCTAALHRLMHCYTTRCFAAWRVMHQKSIENNKVQISPRNSMSLLFIYTKIHNAANVYPSALLHLWLKDSEPEIVHGCAVHCNIELRILTLEKT